MLYRSFAGLLPQLLLVKLRQFLHFRRVLVLQRFYIDNDLLFLVSLQGLKLGLEYLSVFLDDHLQAVQLP